MSSKLGGLSQIRKIIAVAGPLHHFIYLKQYFSGQQCDTGPKLIKVINLNMLWLSTAVETIYPLCGMGVFKNVYFSPSATVFRDSHCICNSPMDYILQSSDAWQEAWGVINLSTPTPMSILPAYLPPVESQLKSTGTREFDVRHMPQLDLWSVTNYELYSANKKQMQMFFHR